MTPVVATEGGYQEFHLHGGEWFILIGSAATAILAVIFSSALCRIGAATVTARDRS